MGLPKRNYTGRKLWSIVLISWYNIVLIGVANQKVPTSDFALRFNPPLFDCVNDATHIHNTSAPNHKSTL